MYDTIASFQLFYVLDLFFFSFLLSMIDITVFAVQLYMSVYHTAHPFFYPPSRCLYSLTNRALNLCSHSIEAFVKRSFPPAEILAA